jgi:CBS domain containing-hemolysin-like protein
MPTVLLQLLAVAALVLLNGFFVAAEFALVKVRDTQLQALAAKGHRRAWLAREIVARLDAALSATQLGITMASLGLGWLGKPVFAALLAPALRSLQVGPEQAEWIAFAIGFTAITILHIVAGELAPKSLAIQKPLPTALWVAAPLLWFYKVLYPFIWVLNHASFWLLRQCGLDPVSETRLAHSDEEIRLILSEQPQNENAASFSHEIALNAFDLRQRQVREVMRPRRDIIAFNTQSSLHHCIELARTTGLSRFPLCEEGDLDRTLGLVHCKDLPASAVRHYSARELANVVTKILFVPGSARLDKLLKLFRTTGLSFALVVNEYGETIGMATREDVLAALLGPVGDESARKEPELAQIDNGWELNGALPVRQLSELLGQNVGKSAQVTTLSGWLTQQLGRFPRLGDQVQLSEWTFQIQAIEDTRVVRARLEPKPKTPNNPEPDKVHRL